MGVLTCLTCQVGFTDSDLHRKHFQGDWHRYNLKRKVANLPSITADEFESRKASHEPKDKGEEKEASTYCIACRKKFGTSKAYENHLGSKKHKKMLLQVGPEAPDAVKEKAVDEIKSKEEKEDDIEMEEIDSDEWEDDPLEVTDCLFCTRKFSTLEKNATHMTETHSFFLPDPEYLVDVQGLMEYLGAKVGQGMMCLWCTTGVFKSVEAVQKHMKDKGHCKMLHEGDALVEYDEYYDYSSSYPEGADGNPDKDAEVNLHELDDSGYILTLPSGATVGHRSLHRYYKQSLNPNREIVLAKSKDKSGSNKLLSTYRAFGWTGTSKLEVARKVRDIKFMHKHMNKRWMRQGCKNNMTMMPHFHDRNEGLQ